MAYEYIHRTYGVEFKPGERIAMDGKPGTVTRPRNDTQYLRVRFDGQKHISNAHPTWRIERLPGSNTLTEAMMADAPPWFPLRLAAHRSQQVLDADGYVFADARNTEAASIIVLKLNEAVRRDFGVE